MGVSQDVADNCTDYKKLGVGFDAQAKLLADKHFESFLLQARLFMIQRLSVDTFFVLADLEKDSLLADFAAQNNPVEMGCSPAYLQQIYRLVTSERRDIVVSFS